MEMSPEAKKKAEEDLKKDDAGKVGQAPSTTALRPELAAFLCYVLNWISGLVFLLVEQKNGFVRFHAAQSLIIFAGLSVISIIVSAVPVSGPFLNVPITVLFIVLWIFLAVRSWQGRWYRIPVIAEQADALEKASLPENYRSQETHEKPAAATAKPAPANAMQQKTSAAAERHMYFTGNRVVRTLGSSIAIFWSFVFLILLNFYSNYLAYYHRSTAGAAWTMDPVITPDYYSWLPQVNIALITAIIARLIMIIFDNPIVYETLRAIINLLFAMAIGSLLVLFPFVFTAIPDRGVAAAMPSAVRLFLLLILAAFIISAVLRLVRLGLHLARNLN